jgi:hypothetical protein
LAEGRRKGGMGWANQIERREGWAGLGRNQRNNLFEFSREFRNLDKALEFYLRRFRRNLDAGSFPKFS